MTATPAIDPGNMILGPAMLYFSPFGSTEPTDLEVGAGAPSSPWTFAGGTNGGVSWDVAATMTDLKVDQIVDQPGARLTDRKTTITASLSEPTLANIVAIMNETATITTGVGFAALDPQSASAATQPTYCALLVDGWAPAGALTGVAQVRRFIARKCLADAKVTMKYDKAGQVDLSVTWSAYFVSAAINVWHLVDEVTVDG